MSANKDKSPAK